MTFYLMLFTVTTIIVLICRWFEKHSEPGSQRHDIRAKR